MSVRVQIGFLEGKFMKNLVSKFIFHCKEPTITKTILKKQEEIWRGNTATIKLQQSG